MFTIRSLRRLVTYRYLILQFVRRDLVLRYRGSVLGIGWSLLYPLLLLAAFTSVFRGVFDGRWGLTGAVGGFELALLIYCGLSVFSPFSEILTTTPRLLLNNQNFVKKIIFPTEILPLVAVLAAWLQGFVHISLLLIVTIFVGTFQPLALLAPIAILPAIMFAAGVAWIFSAVGAYARDLAHGAPVLAQLLMFVLPVFYPAEAAPTVIRHLNTVNPLSNSIEAVRNVIVDGHLPDGGAWLLNLCIGTVVALIGLVFFSWCKEEFADAL